METRAKRKLDAVRTSESATVHIKEEPSLIHIKEEPSVNSCNHVVKLLIGGHEQFVTRSNMQALLPDLAVLQSAHNPQCLEYRINLPADMNSFAVHAVLLAAFNPGIPLDSNSKSHGLTLDMLHRAAGFLKISWQTVGLAPLQPEKPPPPPVSNKASQKVVSLVDIQYDFEIKATEPEFLELTLAEILKLVKESFLGVSSEINVYQAVMRWCNHRYPSRCTKEIFDLLLPEIRWDLLPGTLPVAVLTAVGPLRDTLISIQTSVSPAANLFTVQHRDRYHTEKLLLFFADRNQVNLKVFDWRTNKVSPMPLPPDITAWSVYKDMGPVINGALWFRVQQGAHIKTLAYSLGDKKVLAQFDEPFVSGQYYLMGYLNGMVYKWNMKNDANGVSGAAFKFNPESRTFVLQNAGSHVPWPKYSRTEGASDCCNGKLYLCGGTRTLGQGATAVVEVFDSRNAQWSSLPSMLEPRRCFAAKVCNGFLYVTGGAAVGSSALLSTCERLKLNDPFEKWERIANLNWPRYQHCVFVADDQVYVCGGYTANGVQVNSMEMYDPLRNRWNRFLNSEGKGFDPISACVTVRAPYKVFGL